jgi:hypothetical protein
MATYGKLEAMIKIPTGGWAISVTDAGGTDTITVPAGEYYLSSVGDGSNDLLAELQSQLNASGTFSGTYTISGALGEAGTGKITFACTINATVAATGNVWDSATGASDLQDLLGFNGQSITASQSETGDDSAESVWLPDNYHWTEYGDSDSGWTEHASRGTEAPDGTSVTFAGSKKTVNSIRWHGITRQKARVAGEVVSGESYQRFWEDWQGDGGWSVPSRVRLYWDADDDATFVTYHYTGGFEHRPARFTEDWNGLWIIELERLVKQ